MFLRLVLLRSSYLRLYVKQPDSDDGIEVEIGCVMCRPREGVS